MPNLSARTARQRQAVRDRGLAGRFPIWSASNGGNRRQPWRSMDPNAAAGRAPAGRSSSRLTVWIATFSSAPPPIPDRTANDGAVIVFKPSRAHSSGWLERIPDKDEVPGSNPGGPTAAGRGDGYSMTASSLVSEVSTSAPSSVTATVSLTPRPRHGRRGGPWHARAGERADGGGERRPDRSLGRPEPSVVVIFGKVVPGGMVMDGIASG